MPLFEAIERETMEKCDTCQREFSIVVDEQIKRKAPGYGKANILMQTVASSVIRSLFCPFCGAAQLSSNGARAGMLRIGSHIWRVHIHEEFSTSDIEFRDDAGNVLVIMRNVG